MNPREQSLAYVLLGAMVLVAGGVGGYLLIFQPYQQLRGEEAALDKEIGELEAAAQAQQDAAARMTAYKHRSLPADKNLAQKEYIYLLNQLLENAGAPPGYSVQLRPVDNTARYVPEISKGRPVYTRLACQVTIKKADMWVIKDFLRGYYELGLLQQVTHLNIKRDEDNSAKGAGRRDVLTVDLTTEALVIDGAENRRTLLPVPTGFAAAGGGLMYKAMTLTPEAGRGVVPFPPTKMLAAAPRDYGLLVFRDPFNGPLKQPPPFKLEPFKDIKMDPDATGPPPLKVAVSGEGSQRTKVTASVTGTLFPKGAVVKVDPTTLAVTLPKPISSPTSADTATVTIVAVNAEGKELTSTFNVSPVFKVGKIDDVKLDPAATKPATVKVPVKGESLSRTKITASVSGTLFPKGTELKVDPATLSITLPEPSAVATSLDTATISVVATSATGEQQKASFKVSMTERKAEKVDTRPDVSASILLIGAIPRSDGTAWARVKDNANRLRYNIDVQDNPKTGKKELVVVKEWFVLEWKKDKDHAQPPGVLHISDESVKTDRLFKVVAITPEGLVVIDLRADNLAPPKPGPTPKGPIPKGGRPGSAPPAKPGHPIAAVGGNMAVAAIPTLKYYLWPIGRSLLDLQPLTDDEVVTVLRLVAEKGPVLTELTTRD